MTTTAVLPSVVVRPATAADAEALTVLAALDSAVVPAAPLSVAEVDGVIRAAVSRHDGRAIADPFHRTADLVALLRTGGAASRAPRRRRAIRRSLAPAAG